MSFVLMIMIAHDNRLANIHPGEILGENFLIGGEIAFDDVALGKGLGRERLAALIEEREAVDADADIRLGRYFGMSESFFLGLQNCFNLEEARRAHGAEFDRIVRRAA